MQRKELSQMTKKEKIELCKKCIDNDKKMGDSEKLLTH